MRFLRILPRVALLALDLAGCVAGINSIHPNRPGRRRHLRCRVRRRRRPAGDDAARYLPLHGWRRELDARPYGRSKTGRSRHLAVNPANRNQVLFGSRRFGLARSIDGGVTWASVPSFRLLQTYLSVGLIEFRRDGSVAWMAPQNGGTLYRSTRCWVRTGPRSTPAAHAIYSRSPSIPLNPQTAVCPDARRRFVSSDGGTTSDTARVRAFRGNVRGFAHDVEHSARDELRRLSLLSVDQRRCELGADRDAACSWPPA